MYIGNVYRKKKEFINNLKYNLILFQFNIIFKFMKNTYMQLIIYILKRTHLEN